jgi:hypothetical protein
MSVRMFSAMLLLAALTACAVAPPPPPQAAGFAPDGAVGRKIDDAIAVNGPPSLQWDLPDGRRAYQWQQSSVTARVGAPEGVGGAVVGAASQTTCYYTLYTLPDGKGLWKVVGYEQPRPGCGRLAMNR